MTTTLVSLVSYLSLFSVLCSCNKIYLFGISCSAFSFSCCSCREKRLSLLLQCTLCLLEGPSAQFLLCAVLMEIWKQSLSRSVSTESGSENFEPGYSKIITFRKSTFRNFHQEGEKQPLSSPSLSPTPCISLLLALAIENSSKMDYR